MGRYDERRGNPAAHLRWDPKGAEDPRILAWWTERHEAALRQAIDDFGPAWQFRCSQYVREELSDEDLIAWARSDPRIKPRGNPNYDEAWNLWAGGAEGRVNQFCWAFAHVNGLAPEPDETAVPCGLCQQDFEARSVPANLVERLGVEQIDICTPCLRDTLMRFRYGTAGDAKASATQIRDFIVRLVELTGRIPPANYGYDLVSSLWGLSTNERAEVLRLLTTRPSRERIREVHGSWLAALVDAGVLEDDAHQTARGIRSIASDGHYCLSLGERTICEALTAAGIPHDKEVAYPERRFRADFRVGTTLIEYAGLAGEPAYDEAMRAKSEIAERHGLSLVVLGAEDLADGATLTRRLKRLASGS